ncbi:MAG TPA: hypothetical protein DEP35_09315, partial [Deltaproteobacteria bacterium]|nr:hypothetical protein [Deltaproteobacteria bacterium]
MKRRVQWGLAPLVMLACLLFAGGEAGSARAEKLGAPPPPHRAHPRPLTPAERQRAVQRWRKATPEEREQLRQRYGERWRSLPPEEKARLREEMRKEQGARPGGGGQPPAPGAPHPPGTAA